ncbi:transmembrane 220 family protein [Arenibacter latericius]|uniref:transmembrane 220 family protein n=1 Tax=Arenibacter latericius TaxID=86104 RepID=UPI00047E8C76|nr:transmembrane 220 family protein [Arenibacter latericius]
MKLFSKIFAFIFAILFVWSAVLQYNDQDAWMWYAIYGIAALASVFFIFNRLLLSVGVLLSFAYLIGSYIFWPEKYEGVSIGGGDIDNIERARESLGLLISAMVMLFYAWRIRFSKKA